MASYAYVTVDVFTSVRFGGNPLAVIPDARGLSDSQMAHLAREFNYSETTFVLPPDDPANTARVRIFTPTAEIPFAGHPNVGTGFVLGRAGTLFDRPVGGELRFEEVAGLVDVEVARNGTGVTGARITAPEPVSIGKSIDPRLAAACVGIAESDIRTDRHPPQVVSVGLPLGIVELSDLDSLARARPVTDLFREANAAMPEGSLQFSIYLYVRVSDDPLTVRARMFAPLDNIPEDPATGSAAGALGGLLATIHPLQTGDFHITVEQGVEMGRPSTIELDVRKENGAVNRVTIGGQCIEVMRGTLEL